MPELSKGVSVITKWFTVNLWHKSILAFMLDLIIFYHKHSIVFTCPKAYEQLTILYHKIIHRYVQLVSVLVSV